MYKFDGNLVSWCGGEPFELTEDYQVRLMDGALLVTDEYVFIAAMPLFHLDSKLQARFLDPETFEIHQSGEWEYYADDKIIFLNDNYICSRYGARILDHGFIATNTKIFHAGEEQRSLVKKLGCNPKQVKVVDKAHLRDDSGLYKFINAYGEPWIKVGE